MLAWIDAACLALLNLGLAAEVGLVFLNTVARLFHGTVLLGQEETARLFLIWVAFVGGGVAYGRGRFMAVTALVERLPPRGQDLAAAVVDWVVTALAAVIGGASIPLLAMNAGVRSTLLGIPYRG